MARHRKAAGIAAAWRLSLAEVGMVYGTVPWVWMILLPGSRAGAVPGRVSLVPLHDLLTIFADGPLRATGQIVGNLLVFAALGFFAPQRFAALASVLRILALATTLSVLVETAQYALHLDRVSSVDDVLLNAAGAALAALVSRRWWRTAANADACRSGQPVDGGGTSSSGCSRDDITTLAAAATGIAMRAPTRPRSVTPIKATTSTEMGERSTALRMTRGEIT